MSLHEFAVATRYSVIECCQKGCNCLFAMTLDMNNQRLADGKNFFCPNGHSQVYTDTEVARLKRQAAAARGQVTKIKNRVGNGVCPCCKRSFSNLQRHMSHQHPDFKKEQAHE